MIFIRLLDAIAMLYVILIAVRALMVWFKPEVLYAYKKFFAIVSGLVDPLIGFVRKVFPTDLGRVDLSPVIAVILVETVKFMLQYLIKMMLQAAAA